MKPFKCAWKNYGYCGKHGFGSCKCLSQIPTWRIWEKELEKALWKTPKAIQSKTSKTSKTSHKRG